MLVIILVLAVSGHNIMNYGAVPYNTSTAACNLNSAAIEKAFSAAIQADKDGGDKEVLVPTGDFYTMPFQASNGTHVTFTVNGSLWASSDNLNWPTY
jgi:hypothetical protein